MTEKTWDNEDRTRCYGKRVGDIVHLGKRGDHDYGMAEVTGYCPGDNNRLKVRKEGEVDEIEWVAEYCDIIVKVEDKSNPLLNPALDEKLSAELKHIFESGSNEIRIKNLLTQFINRHYSLTPEEMQIIDMTVYIWNKFHLLERRTDQDKVDMADAIHLIQRIMMSRLARRVHPNTFNR